MFLPALWAPLVGLLLHFSPPLLDAADDKAAYVEGLADRGLHALVVDAAEDFLDDYASHDRAATVRYRLADALFELDRNEAALPHWRVLAQIDDFQWQAESRLRLGQTELSLGDASAAVSALTPLSESGPQYLRLPALALLGEAHVRLESWDAASAAFDDVLSIRREGEYADDARVGLAWADYRRGRFEPAAQRAQELLDSDLTRARRDEVAFLAGESLLELDRPVEATAAYQRVSEGPFRTGAVRGEGFAQARAGNPAAAAQAFSDLLERDIDAALAAEASLQLGNQLYQTGRHEEALTALSGPRAANDASTLYWRGLSLLALERPEDALIALDAGLQTASDSALVGFLQGARGDALTSLGRRAEAAEAYSQAGSQAALHAAAVSLLNSGDSNAALAQIEALIEREPEDVSLRLTRAEALFALGRYAEAEPDFQTVVSGGTPEQAARASSRLAWCRYLQESYEEAAQLFGGVVKQHPGTAGATEAAFMEGRAWRLAGRDTEAVDAWRRFADSTTDAPRRDEALMGMAELLPGDAGIGILERLLAEHPETPLRPRAQLEIAERHSAVGRCEQAEPAYAKLVPFEQDITLEATARYGYAWCLQARGAYDAADEVLRPLVVPWLEPQSSVISGASEELAMAGLELLTWISHEAARPEDAERCVRALAEMGAPAPRVLDAARTTASAWRTAERPDRALALLGELALSEEAGVDALVESVWVALDSSRPEDAVPPMTSALERSPDAANVAEAAFFLGEALFTAGDYTRAAGFYAASSRAREGTLTDKALYKEGFSHLSAEDPASAAVAFERLVVDFPESPLVGETLFLLGESRFRLDDFEAAAPPLQRLLDEHKGHDSTPKARFRLGLALGQLENWDASEAVLADLARFHPDFPQRLEAELWRARALAALGSARSAQAAFERVIAEDRSVLAARARLGLGRLHLNEGSVDAALSEFLKVAVLYGNADEVAEALVMAGHSLERLGDRDQARARYEEAIDRYPDTSWAFEARERLGAL